MRRVLAMITFLPGFVFAEFSGTVFLNSDYRLYGYSQTLEDPALQVELVFALDNGFSAGTFASNVDFVEDSDPADLDATIEVDLFAGYEYAIDDNNVVAGTVIRYIYPGTEVDLDYNELIIDYISMIGVFTIGYSNDAFALDDDGIRYEYSYEYSITDEIGVALQIGHYDLDDVLGDSYTYYNVSASYNINNIGITLTYDGSDSTAEDLFGDVADDAVVLGLSYSF